MVSGSITDAALCARAMTGATHVFHLAVAMREGGKRDEFFERVNLEGTRRLLEAAVAGRVERFVYCSTIGIYGHRAPGVTREGSPLSPGNIYERTKVAAEAMVREFGAAHRLPVVILRPADVYGPRDQRLLKLFRGVSRGRFPLFGRGDGRRHMVYVDDVVSAFFMACERQGSGGAGHDHRRAAAVCTLRELIETCSAPAGARGTAVGCRSRRCSGVAAVVEDVCRCSIRPADLPAADGFLLD